MWNWFVCSVVWAIAIPCVLSAPEGCDVLKYLDVNEPPERTKDDRDTCPEGNGPRAFVYAAIEAEGPEAHRHGGSPRSAFREVAPGPNQRFFCLTDRKCFIVVRGFGLRFFDSIAVLPVGLSSCPPSVDLLTDGGSGHMDMPVLVQSSDTASLIIRSSNAVPASVPVSFTVFELPDRAFLANGTHTVCYAPVLATEKPSIDNLVSADLHYEAGVLEIGGSLLSCDFEEPVPALEGDLAAVPLPCGFRNYRARWDVNLVWQLGVGSTETSGTGPDHDTTPGLNGTGHYVYMDSPGYALGAPAILVSPPVAYPSGGFCVQFAYNMHGSDVSSLRVYAHEIHLSHMGGEADRATRKNRLGDWGNPKWVAVGNKGDRWHRGGFEFEVSASMQTYQVVFEALAGKSEYGDIAVDDVSVTAGRCPAEVRFHLPKTVGLGDQALVCGEVRLITGKNAADKSWYVDGAVSCAGKGYSLDDMNQTAWLPCCVPHFGAYKLVLQDAFGDGWSGSKLEFRFFDRVVLFGNDEFQNVGFDTSYNLVIGTLEVVEIRKPADNTIQIGVRVARPQSYVWCGVVQAGKNGKPLKVDLTPDLLQRYGVRSSQPTTIKNQLVTLEVKGVLKAEIDYDLYCYSEVVGEAFASDHSIELLRHEIAASRLRVSTDRQPPQLSAVKTSVEFKEASLTFTVDESSSIYCVALPTKKDQSALFGTAGPLEGLLDRVDDREGRLAMIRYFESAGNGMEVVIGNRHPTEQSLTISELIPDTEYEIYCYAEDTAAPVPNGLSPADVAKTKVIIKTKAKVPEVQIVRRQTLHRGFRLFVKTDAPGKVWCAAAPGEYGIPSVQEVVRVGAGVDIDNPSRQGVLEVRGVKANTLYDIYCVSSPRTEQEEDRIYSGRDQMILSSISLISYGKYCEALEGPETYKIVEETTPFHPLSADEEMQIRNYILARPELNLEGVYRITLLQNKTEIYDFYDGKAPKPLRYARVRAGRCLEGTGYYEQLRVGPLGGSRPLSYERISQPIETECGGYNPQGVFGRRLTEDANNDTALEELSGWFKRVFGYELPTSLEAFKDGHEEGDSVSFGPVVIEEACDSEKEGTPCPSKRREGRIWLGVKTSTGEQVPFYLIYSLPPLNGVSEETQSAETAKDWVQRILRSHQIPPDFHHFWTVSAFWLDGAVYHSLEELLLAETEGRTALLTKEALAERRRLEEAELRDHIHEAKNRRLQQTGTTADSDNGSNNPSMQERRLDPVPFFGAAGTAGPLPTRQTRRGGLEYRAHPEHVESQGKRFTVEASEDQEAFTINYAGWNMTVVNDRDTALTIYYLTFQGERVAFEMGLMEALAHYSVAERNWFFLDSWYGGLGSAARKVHKGIECPKTAVSLFWDGSLCVFEQDMARPMRSHWKSGEIRDGAPHLTLVLRQMLTVSNYDYVTDYVFHLNGIFEASVTFTGELYAGIEVPWYSARQADYGAQVTGAMRFAALHNHMAAWKIDFDIGKDDHWKRNSVLLTEVIPDPSRPGANKLKRTFAETEKDAAYFRNDTRALIYEVVDDTIKIFGNVGGWRVVPQAGANPLHHDFELYSGPAAWAKYRVFTTLHRYSELDSTLPRDNKYARRPAVSVDRYVMDDEPIRHGDLVTWISDGIFHVPVIEDMPLTIPVGNKLGWMVKPSNLFFEDPSMDLRNAMGGGLEDPGTCAVVRSAIGEVEPILDDVFSRPGAPPIGGPESA